MRNQIINHGFRIPKIDDTHYIFGGLSALPKVVLRSDCDWRFYLPKPEDQFNGQFETFGCTVFNTLNILEMLLKRLKDQEDNKSDRYLYITSETQPPGNDPHLVAQQIHEGGVVAESSLPFSKYIDTFAKFQSMEGREQPLMREASAWLKQYSFGHEWIFNTRIPLAEKQALLKECLQYSPVGVAVRAWLRREDGYYFKDIGDADTHWTCLVGFVEGEYWIVFDSYPDSVGDYIKLLEWNYDFGYAKRYSLTAPSSPQSKPSLFDKILAIIKKIFNKKT